MKKRLIKYLSLFLILVMLGVGVFLTPFNIKNVNADSTGIYSPFNLMVINADSIDADSFEGKVVLKINNAGGFENPSYNYNFTVSGIDASSLLMDSYYFIEGFINTSNRTIRVNNNNIIEVQQFYINYFGQSTYNLGFNAGYNSGLSSTAQQVLAEGIERGKALQLEEQNALISDMNYQFQQQLIEEKRISKLEGLQQGRNENISESLTSPSYIFNTLADGADNILSLHIAPNITIGLLIFVPLFFVVLGAIISYWRKH